MRSRELLAPWLIGVVVCAALGYLFAQRSGASPTPPPQGQCPQTWGYMCPTCSSYNFGSPDFPNIAGCQNPGALGARQCQYDSTSPPCNDLAVSVSCGEGFYNTATDCSGVPDLSKKCNPVTSGCGLGGSPGLP